MALEMYKKRLQCRFSCASPTQYFSIVAARGDNACRHPLQYVADRRIQRIPPHRPKFRAIVRVGYSYRAFRATRRHCRGRRQGVLPPICVQNTRCTLKNDATRLRSKGVVATIKHASPEPSPPTAIRRGQFFLGSDLKNCTAPVVNNTSVG